DYLGESAKLNVAKDLIIKNIFRHKILLFSQFTTVLKRMEKELKQEKIDYCYIDGSTSSKNRIKFVDEFNTNEQKRVFLISLKAGGTGLNLTSADMVIHFDPWWNPSVEEQATDRAHRIGQKHIVEVIKLIAKDTIEEKIMLLQEDKKILINNIITEELEDINITSALKSEELLDLLLN
ncbi:DEAD/DEAH box helicase, partial [Clostridium saccharobutylicum]